ncbi:MAG: DedA family protein [Candidatus Latescibacterota bacterium]
MGFLGEFFEWFLGLDAQWMYPILFISALVENVLPFLPGDTVTVVGAYLVGRGRLGLIPVIATTVCGSLVGFMGIYYLAYTRGQAFFTVHLHRILSKKHVRRAQRWIDRYGDRVILINRFLAGLRSTVAVFAGLGGLRPRRVFLYSFVSISLWNGILIYSGFLMGSNWGAVIGCLKTYSEIVWISILVGLLGGVGGVYWRKRRNRLVIGE